MEKIKKFIIGGGSTTPHPEDILRALGDLYQRQNLVSPGMAIKSGGASPQFLTGANSYLIGGKLYQAAAVAANSLNAGITWAAVASTYSAGAYIIALDNAGTLYALPTNVSSTTTSQAAALAGIVWPAVPDTFCVIGVIVVSTSSANTAFTGGTTNLDAAGITTNYINITGPFYPVPAF